MRLAHLQQRLHWLLTEWGKETVAMRCERLGHKMAVKRRSGYRYPSETWGVADDVCQERTICRRCGFIAKDWADVDVERIDSLRMPGEDWRILKRDGELWT